jgi:hypothetical protein
MAKNTEKSMFENVQALTNKLRELQYGLPPDLRSVTFLHNKLVTACQGIPACRYAVSDPPADLGLLINKLQSSITSYEKEQEHNTEAFFTDRRYHSRNAPSGRPGYRHNSNRFNRSPSYQQRGRCFICKKEDCRSWKHTPEEQRDSKAKFKTKNIGRFNPNIRDFNRRFDTHFSQYVADYEGEDSEDELHNSFEALLVENSDSEPEEPQIGDINTAAYITSYGSLSVESATLTTSKLVNRAFAYQVITDIPS